MTEEEANAKLPECGRRLRRTREQLGLSVDDIASELRLSAFQIRALENDEWDHLPGTTYARGYVKSYARLLGLDADQLLAGASTEEIEISRTEPAIDNRAPSAERTVPGGQSRVPWGWVLGVIVVCVLVVAVWQSRLVRQFIPGLTGLQSPSTSGSGIATGESGGDGAGAAETAPPEAGMDAGTAASAAWQEASDQPGMPTAPDRIVFQFDQRSWVDVRDARGRRLLYRAFRAGRRIEVRGQPPFRVYLGNAGGVSVEYLGDTISPKAVSGRLFARFVVGEPTG